MIDWTTISAAGLASFVEFVEALTIVMAVGSVRGWRPAILGTITAFVALVVLVCLLGPHFSSLDVPLFKAIVGTLLLLFGLRWLRKAILRSAGVIPLNDEARRFARKREALKKSADPASGPSGIDMGAAATAFNGVFIEGVEVVFIVLAVGGTRGHGQLLQASIGAALAAIAVIVLGLVARHPLTRIPENALKFAVGVLVSAFGTLWAGEGLHLTWPGGEYSLPLLSFAYLLLGFAGVGVVRAAVAGLSPVPPNPARSQVRETP